MQYQQQQQQYGDAGYAHPEDFQSGPSSKLLPNARANFVKKVYGIVSTQLAATVAICYLSMAYPAFRRFQQAHEGLVIFMALGALVSSIALVCGNLSRKVPVNYYLLAAFTLCESYTVAFTCTYFDPQIVLAAASATLALTLCLTAYAFTTKRDFTITSGSLFVFFTSLTLIAVMNIFVRTDTLSNILTFGLLISYGIYLIVDTQKIMGGKRGQISLDDYIPAAIQLYVDIIGLFLELLRLLDKLQKKAEKK
jgi:FtsH-binding integral membrane protein